MTSVFKPIARQNDIVVQNLKGETLIYDLTTDKAFALNETAAGVWKYSDGKNNIETIAALLSDDFGKTVSDDMVLIAVEQLQRDNLLTSTSKPVEGFSRREALRRIGIASAVALPVVTALVAPKAAQAGSNCSNYTCVNLEDCPTFCTTCSVIPSAQGIAIGFCR